MENERERVRLNKQQCAYAPFTSTWLESKHLIIITNSHEVAIRISCCKSHIVRNLISKQMNGNFNLQLSLDLRLRLENFGMRRNGFFERERKKKKKEKLIIIWKCNRTKKSPRLIIEQNRWYFMCILFFLSIYIVHITMFYYFKF